MLVSIFLFIFTIYNNQGIPVPGTCTSAPVPGTWYDTWCLVSGNNPESAGIDRTWPTWPNGMTSTCFFAHVQVCTTCIPGTNQRTLPYRRGCGKAAYKFLGYEYAVNTKTGSTLQHQLHQYLFLESIEAGTNLEQ